MSQKAKPGLLLMAFTNDSVSEAVYPRPGVGVVANEPKDGYGITGVLGNSPFGNSSGTKDAILYSVNGSNGPGNLILQSTSGDSLMTFQGGPLTAVGVTYEFGPDGIRIPGGFRVKTQADKSDTWVITYEVV
tara:strand:- start:3693 stop:4088 length:396 start_codon:yes stop_codon:yes gene_type:complete